MTGLRRFAVIVSLVAAVAVPAVRAEQPGPPKPTGPVKPGVWISKSEVIKLPMSGRAWDALKFAADLPAGTPDLSNQDQLNNVYVLAKALVFARTGDTKYRDGVIAALQTLANAGPYDGRSLALGRELGAYAIAADLVDLKTANAALDTKFRAKLRELLTTPCTSGPTNLVKCHELRPNNWGAHAGASRAAVAAYLGDQKELAGCAQVMKGYLGDRTSWAGFIYGADLSYQSDPSKPVGVNPKGATKDGHNFDGIMPDDMRRSGPYQWPPLATNYNWEVLEPISMGAEILSRQGYDVWNWQDKAILRATQRLYDIDREFPDSHMWKRHHEGGNKEIPDSGVWGSGPDITSHAVWVINRAYSSKFPTQSPVLPGKGMGWTDWTHAPAP